MILIKKDTEYFQCRTVCTRYINWKLYKDLYKKHLVCFYFF